VFFCIADHFEPSHGTGDGNLERARVAAWVDGYPRLAERFADADGRPPQHTFFFPEEDYRPELLDALAGLCRRGFGSVEVHLHHDNDTPAALRDRLGAFTEALFHRHGLLRRGPDGRLIIQGPLMFDMRRRIWKVFPGLENGAIDNSDAHLPTLDRFASWVDAGIAIAGRPEWIFVKAYTHGAIEDNAAALLGATMHAFHTGINRVFNDGIHYRLHYVTAHEMATLIKAAEAGLEGSPRELMRQTLL
jgi:hypothetical protein